MSKEEKYYHRKGDCLDRLMYRGGGWYARVNRHWESLKVSTPDNLSEYIESVIEHLD